MDRIQLSPLAETLIEAYFDTASYSSQFRDEHGQPPTTMAKAHHFRSIVQAILNRADGYELDDQFAEFGRVGVFDREWERHYLLRSDGAVRVESRTRQSEAMFDATRDITSDVVILVYDFQLAGLSLSAAGSCRQSFRRRLEPAGQPTYIHTWPYVVSAPPPFDQGERGNPFYEVGDLPDDAAEENS